MQTMKRYAAKAMLIALAVLLLALPAAAEKLGSGTVTASALRLRAQGNTAAETLTMIPCGAKLEIAEESGDWYLTAYNGLTGYVHKDYVTLLPAAAASVPGSTATLSEAAKLALSLVSSVTVSAADNQTAALRQAIVDEACNYLGVRYRYGGSGPSGFDCSGFTSYVYKQFGYELTRSAASQLGCGTAVEKDALVMGDLVFFRDTRVSSKAASHVGIYIGNDKFVHASSSSTGYVIVSSLDEDYFARYYTGARRIIN